MDILLIRHGMTAGNLRRCYLGVTDEPLCPQGRAALAPLDEALETVYVSPLLRARETASILFPRARQIPVEGLREMDFGAFEGKNFEDLSDDPDYRAWVDANCEPPCPGGESRAQFMDRTCRAFETLVDEALSRREARLVIVAHGGTAMAAASRYGLPRRDYYDWLPDNGGILHFTVEERLWRREKTMQWEGSLWKSC